jgi:hypothetical protein
LEILSEQFRQAGFEVQSNHIYNILTKEDKVAKKTTNYDQFMLIAKKNK